MRLVENIREAILNDSYEAFKIDFLNKTYNMNKEAAE
jgi:queuine/archaeosine tRNA-ribosyltransferase